jgi:mycothiol synthase
MTVRPIELPADARAVEELANRLQGISGLSILSESKWIGVRKGTAGGFLAETEGRVVAYTAIVRTATPGEAAMEVLFDAPRESLGPLIDAVIVDAHRSGISALRWWVYGQDAAPIPAEFDFEPERELLHMARSLPTDEDPHFPPEIEIAAFRPGVDGDLWLEANNAAFAGHPENGALTRTDLADRLAADWFSADGFRMAWAGGESGGDLAGFCWTKVHPSGEGEIYIIAVAPGHWGGGLGRQLVLEGMRHLTAEGCDRVFLYTEADNVRGVALYRSLGFQVQETHRSFRMVL